MPSATLTRMVGVVVRAALVVAIALSFVASGSGAPGRGGATVYAGLGFDTCSAPPLASMQSWLGSPYRAVGVYLGGANRACPDGNLSSGWTAGAVALGWNLLPLYVGLQAPCVAQGGLALIDPSRAARQGLAAADDAVVRAGFFGLQPGGPVYFDMEGYSTVSPACTATVQAFLAGWSSELRDRGYVAGVYGSAASTIRDLSPAAGMLVGPDAVWIANWNARQSVFGDPFVPDGLWAAHQRIHQYAGGHRETYAGTTINIDANAVDGPVVGPGSVVPVTPPPPPPVLPVAGSLTTSDGAATVSWPATAFPSATTVQATPSSLPAEADGFAAGSYVVTLGARSSSGVPVKRFAAPVTVTFRSVQPGLVPAVLSGGGWKAQPAQIAADGSLAVSTSLPGKVGLLRDIAPPAAPAAARGRLIGGRLQLSWNPSTDNSGAVATYEIARNGQPLAAAAPGAPTALVRGFFPHGPSIFRVSASDAAGNASPLSSAVVVQPTARPTGLPKQIPAWAFQLLAWQEAHRTGTRPAAPRTVPAWYWRWQSWRLHPFRVASP